MYEPCKISGEIARTRTDFIALRSVDTWLSVSRCSTLGSTYMNAVYRHCLIFNDAVVISKCKLEFGYLETTFREKINFSPGKMFHGQGQVSETHHSWHLYKCKLQAGDSPPENFVIFPRSSSHYRFRVQRIRLPYGGHFFELLREKAVETLKRIDSVVKK